MFKINLGGVGKTHESQCFHMARPIMLEFHSPKLSPIIRNPIILNNIPKNWVRMNRTSKCLTASEFGIGHSLFMIAKIQIWYYQLLYAILFLFNLFLYKIHIKLKLIFKTQKICSWTVLLKHFHHFLNYPSICHLDGGSKKSSVTYYLCNLGQAIQTLASVFQSVKQR